MILHNDLFFFFSSSFLSRSSSRGWFAVFVLGAIVLFCGNMLGLIQESPKETTKAESADPATAVDEKTLIKIETEIPDMLRTRQAKLEKLVKDD